ncbi:hypothetical protein LXL04_034177 [Taraxacum kok-saghyz]
MAVEGRMAGILRRKTQEDVGKQARKHQTWSIVGYLAAKMLLEDLSHLGMISLEDDRQLKPIIKQEIRRYRKSGG